MEINFKSSWTIKQFFKANTESFESVLLSEAVNVKDKIDEILRIGNIDLINNAHHLVVCIINNEDEELKRFAKQEGIAWASHSIELTFKLEWVQAIRRSLWTLIQKYYELTNNFKFTDFFQLEQEINNRVDMFLNTFFLNYTLHIKIL